MRKAREIHDGEGGPYPKLLKLLIGVEYVFIFYELL